ncbi:MAG: hypothetical protein K2X77_04980 [Candidatus Obscuribacterales bacterium]|nr:hypothetical protein [Candidatus Obscuribacterales bacterium]
MSTRRHRNNKGSMLILIIAVSVLIFVPLFIFIGQLAPYFVFRGKAENVVDAAALVAANDLSKIVMNDSHFGYVSLSNYPATGKAIKARDGESLPVIGINTLIGTLRHNAVVADAIKNQTMDELVERDYRFLYRTQRDLSSRLNDALNGLDDACFDIDGNRVNPLEDVKEFLTQNLPSNMEVESMKMSLGWLDGGSDTTIEAPQPQALAKVAESDLDDGKYQAFKNYPVGSRWFNFAGLGKQSHMVSTKKFKEADNFHMCTVIKLECTLVSKEDHHARSEFVVCSQPGTRPDEAIRGAMTVRFSGTPMPGLLSWNDFLMNGSFTDNKITSYYVVGDFPYDPNSRMQQSKYQKDDGTSERFAEHLYNWLRNGRMRPRVDSIISMMSEPFDSLPNHVYTYEFEKDGKIKRKTFDGNHFAHPVVADGQYESMADTRIKSGASAIILFRDNVEQMGANNGKHGGQPLAGYPLDGSNNGEAQISEKFSKRNSYTDGLALDIEIGGTGPSTAKQDIARMIEFTKNRSI